jgi:hypothetical protein
MGFKEMLLMFNLIKSFIISLIFCALVSFGAACNSSAVLNRDGQNPPKENSGIANGDDSSALAGIWKGTQTAEQSTCQVEVVFQKSGQYSSMISCQNINLPVFIRGEWKIVQQGTVRVEIKDADPKEYPAGHPINYPESETLSYHFIDNDRLQINSDLDMRDGFNAELQRAQ